MKKHKHHYVWKHYLEGWATRGQIWCGRGGKRFLTALENVAQQRDFYTIQDVTETDLVWVQHLIARVPNERLRRTLEERVSDLRSFHVLRARYVENGGNDPHALALLEEEMHNVEENLYAFYEGRAVSLLEQLKTGAAEPFLDPEVFASLSYFLALQFWRTPRMLNAGLWAFEVLPGVNLEAVWPFLRAVFALTTSHSVFCSRTTIEVEFLDAPAGHDLITADQPIINADAVGLPKDVPPRTLRWYYPLSPRLALMLNVSSSESRIARRHLHDEEAMQLNDALASEAASQVYASTHEALKTVGR